jgi:hypothetical protein
MTGTYTDVCDYRPSPRSTDPRDIIQEKDIAIRWLKGQLDLREAEIQEREQFIGQLLQELSGIE